MYEAYDQDDVAMEDLAGVTLNDLYRVETTFKKKHVRIQARRVG